MTRGVRVAMALLTAVLVASLCFAADSVRVTVDRANLRQEPSTNSKVVAKVERGAVLQVLARQGEWLRVSAPGGGAAYINARLCEPAPASAPAAAASQARAEPSRSEGSFAQSVRSTAPEPLQLGLNADWANEEIGFGLGARATKGIAAVPHLGALLTFDYFFGARARAEAAGVEVDASGHSLQLALFPTYRFDLGGVDGYVGAGLSYFRVSYSASVSSVAEGTTLEGSGSASSTSLGIVAGAKLGARYFAEIRYQLGDASHVTVSAGVLFDSPW